MDPIEISDLFIKDRLPKIGWQLLQIILYSPCGLALAILRFFILIQAYLAAALLPETSLIRRIVLRIICVVLGVIVQEENRSQLDKKAKVIMTNHITLFDHIPLHLVTGCIASFFPRRAVPMTWGLKDFGIKQGRDIFKEKLQAFLSKAESPLLIHPEEETTSGKVGLLKFSSWYGFASSIVQPVCLKVYRPSIIDISPNILHSSAITDLFWFLFTPFTVFKIKYLPVIIRKTGETDEEIIDRIETDIAQELGVRTTHFNASDKAEYQKRCIADLNSPVIVMAEPSTTSPKNTSHEYESVLASNERMASQVAEILPHVPIEVIKKDLFKTRNIDLTIANILEGVVYYIPIPVAEEPPVSQERQDTRPSTSTVVWPSPITNMESFSKSAQERMMSLAERKKHLIETARKRYIEQHGLNSL